MSTIFTHAAVVCSDGGFFGIPPWYKYLIGTGLMDTSDCSLVTLSTDQWPQVIFLVALAVLDMLLRVAGLIAVIMIIVGGVKYITSYMGQDGGPQKTKAAQETIIEAIIGLIITILAAAIVSFIGKALG